MDAFMELADPKKSFVPKYVTTGQVNGRINYGSDESSSEEESEDFENRENYAYEYQRNEAELYARTINEQNQAGSLSCVDDLDDMLSPSQRAEVTQLKHEEMLRIYNDFTFATKIRADLTIDAHKSEIIGMIHTNSVVIIQGPTGCGKTTQVPQFIIDDCRERGEPCNIVVTQPRRIAAISVAKRVCGERGWQIGQVCGYQVGLEKIVSPDTILTYVTTGVLLQKLISIKNLLHYTHIIIDEVHERTQEMDFLLLLIRKFLYTNSIQVKIVLMSATFSTEKFSHYFRTQSQATKLLAPTIFITKETKFQCTEYYIDQLSALGDVPQYKMDEPGISPSLMDIFVKLIRILDRVDSTFDSEKKPVIGNVLVFLPGIYEIEAIYSKLLENMPSRVNNPKGTPWEILPLHSSITSVEQKKVFMPPSPGHRKIILSTNLAESSITVTDIEYVIDFCLTKTMTVDPVSHYNCLRLEWASKVNCEQRAGRVGRVKDGRVYRLIPHGFYQQLPSDIIPEILRAPLERIILATKLLGVSDSPKAILALAVEPPCLDNIESTILNLKEVGALLLTCRGVPLRSDGDMTFMGIMMAKLPLDVYLSKMICLGYMFSCLDDCIIMAAGCSLSNIFSTPFQERLTAYSNKLRWADGSCSDLIAHLNLYKVWERNVRSGEFSRHKNERQWCETHYLSYRAIKEWSILVTELRDRLNKMGIYESVGADRVILGHDETPMFLKVVMCGAFYPNYYKRSCDGGQVDEREAVRLLNGLNPMETVYFTNTNPSQPGPLYAQRIKEYLKPCSTNMNVHFDTTSKVYVSFLDKCEPHTVTIGGTQLITTMPGNIPMPVYKAIRMRQISRYQLTINVLSIKDSWQRAKELGIAQKAGIGTYTLVKKTQPDTTIKSILPGLSDSTIYIRVCYIIDAGHFYAQHVDVSVDSTIVELDEILNNEKHPLPKVTKLVEVGEIYGALFTADNRVYRCRVMGLTPLNKADVKAHILFIDYGNAETIKPDQLLQIPNGPAKTIPPQAIECVLHNVQPSLYLNSRAIWTKFADMNFKRLTEGVNLIAKVYSVVNGVVSVELLKSTNSSMTLNQWLINQGFAQESEESFLSKENHAKRIAAQNYYEKSTGEVLDLEQNQYVTVNQDVEPPHRGECCEVMHLKGPFSPLEMSIYSVTDCESSKKVTIDSGSVNTVLLDTEPQDPHERLIVSTYISQSPHSGLVTLRHTTLMPNIHGFPALVALLFCPKMEPKPNKDGTMFGALLCGLGASDDGPKSGIAMYAAHDMVVTLDTEIDEEDLKNINLIRYYMNESIKAMHARYCNIESIGIQNSQRVLQQAIKTLLTKSRKSQERIFIRDANKWGKFLYKSELLRVADRGSENADIWPLHWTLSLKPENKKYAMLKRHIDDMHDMAKKTRPMNEITCQLCDVHIYSVPEMTLHLVSKRHKEEESTFLASNDEK